MAAELFRTDHLLVDNQALVGKMTGGLIFPQSCKAGIRCDEGIIEPFHIVSVRAEFIISRVSYDLGPDRIELDILPALNKISLGIDDDTLETSLDEMSDVVMLIPEKRIIGKEDLLQESRKIGIRLETDDQVNMVIHEAIMIDVDSIYRLHLMEKIEEIQLLFAAGEERLSVIPPIHDVHG